MKIQKGILLLMMYSGIISTFGCGSEPPVVGVIDLRDHSMEPIPEPPWVPKPLPTQDCHANAAWSNPILIQGPNANEVSSIAIDKSGHLYATGYQNGLVHIENIDPIGDSTAFVNKFDTTGNLLWRQTLSTPETDTGDSLAIHPIDGRVFLAGRTSGAFAPFTNQGQFDTYVATFAPTGEQLGLIQVGDERPQHPQKLLLGQNNNLLLIGYDDMFVQDLALIDFENPFWNRFHIQEDFSLAWIDEYKVRTSLPDLGIGGAWFDDNQFLMVTDDSLLKGAGFRYFHEDGTQKDSFQFQLSYWLADIVQSQVNTNYLYLLFQGPAAGWGLPIIVGKFDLANKMFVWAIPLGVEFTDKSNQSLFNPNKLTIDEEDNVYVAGATKVPLPGFTQQGDQDVFVQKFDGQTGKELSRWQNGQPHITNYINTVAVDSCGRVFIGGYQGITDPEKKLRNRNGMIWPVNLIKL